jgi:hypothetical protein
MFVRNVLRCRLLFNCKALRHDCGVETFTQLVGDFVDLVALIDMDGLLGGVEDDAAMLATGSVGADFLEQTGAESIVEVVGEMA